MRFATLIVSFFFFVPPLWAEENLWPAQKIAAGPCAEVEVNTKAEWEALGMAILFPDEKGCIDQKVLNIFLSDMERIWRRVESLQHSQLKEDGMGAFNVFPTYSINQVANFFSMKIHPEIGVQIVNEANISGLFLNAQEISDHRGVVKRVQLPLNFPFPETAGPLMEYLRTLPLRAIQLDVLPNGALDRFSVALWSFRDRLQIHKGLLEVYSYVGDYLYWTVTDSNLVKNTVRKIHLEVERIAGYRWLQDNPGAKSIDTPLKFRQSFKFGWQTEFIGVYLKELPLAEVHIDTAEYRHENGDPGMKIKHIYLALNEPRDAYFFQRDMVKFFSRKLQRYPIRYVEYPDFHPPQRNVQFVEFSPHIKTRPYFLAREKGGARVSVNDKGVVITEVERRQDRIGSGKRFFR